MDKFTNISAFRDGWYSNAFYKEDEPNTATMIPSHIVIHYTAGGSMNSAVEWLRMKNNLSVHFVIERNGIITQMTPINKVAYHAGQSSYKNLHGFNLFSIGIELVNWGFCGNGQVPITYTGKELPINDCQMYDPTNKNSQFVKGWYQKFGLQQIHTLTALCRCIALEYTIKEIVGHCDIAPGRKVDPGPLFDTVAFSKSILGG